MSRAASLPGAELFLKNFVFFWTNHLSRAASLPGAELFIKNRCFFWTSHLSRAASLPGAELFLRNRTFVEEATCPGQLRCLGQKFFSEIRLLKKPLVPGSFAAWGRTFSQKSTFFEEATCPGQLRCPGQNFFSEIGLFFLRSHLSRAASLPGAELFAEN